jgi:outer membrane protein assembly factor BamB
MARAILRLIGITLLASIALADDWPQWRGPQRDGVWREQGIVEAFPADGLKIAWRAQAGGGWSSPVVAEGRVFVADSELVQPKARERVRCFDAATGKVLWTYAYDVKYPDWAFTEDQNGGPTSTPAVADEKVYALGANGEVMCLAAATGELLWRKDLGTDYEVESFSCRASPLIDGDLVILFTGGKPDACVLALDRHTGREVWKALNESVANSSPIIITAGGKRQLIVWTGDSVTSLDPASGATYWREPLTTSSSDDNATPVCDGGRLLISGLMFKLDADKPAASVVWPENRGVTKRVLSNTSTPLLAGDAIFSATNRGDLVCLDARTGRELWKTDKVTDHKSGPSIHLTPNGDAAFLYTNRGELIRARLTPAGYEELSRSRLIEPVYSFGGRKVTWSPPAYANRRVFVRNEREIVCASLAADGR